MTYFQADENVVNVDRLKEWPKLIVDLNNALFKVDRTWHSGFDSYLVLWCLANPETKEVARSWRCSVEHSQHVTEVSLTC
jgi:hypothetical protein